MLRDKTKLRSNFVSTTKRIKLCYEIVSSKYFRPTKSEAETKAVAVLSGIYDQQLLIIRKVTPQV